MGFETNMKKSAIYLDVLFILAILLILGCEGASGVRDKLPFARDRGEDTVTRDLFEYSATLGGIELGLIIRPGRERIAVGKPIYVAIEMENNGEKMVTGTYSLIDTPGNLFGGIQGDLSGNFILEPNKKEIIDSITIDYTEELRQTQFILDFELRDETKFVAPNICIKREIEKNVGIECSTESVEKGESSDSSIKISRVDKLLVDNAFDGVVDELSLRFNLNIDSDCRLRKDSLDIVSLDAAGVTGFSCEYNEKTKKVDCNAPASIDQEFIEGPLNIVLGYVCDVKLSTGNIVLNRPEEGRVII